jgi:hypothetical protein
LREVLVGVGVGEAPAALYGGAIVLSSVGFSVLYERKLKNG